METGPRSVELLQKLLHPLPVTPPAAAVNLADRQDSARITAAGSRSSPLAIGLHSFARY
jgi:hypothetical protein